jgi:hypothetical protein
VLASHSGENACHSLEERLARLENRLEEFLERQRLSKFDTLVFLAYPVVLGGITALASALWQYQTLSAVMIGRLPLTPIIGLLGLAFSFWIIGGFLMFLRAYPTDDVSKRIWVFFHLVHSSELAVIVFWVLFNVGFIATLVSKERSVPMDISFFVFLMSTGLFLGLSYPQLCYGLIYKMALWFWKNTPTSI